MRSGYLIVLFLLALLLGACADGEENGDASPTPEATVTAAATARPSATPRPTATATPTATPEPQAAVEAVAQAVDEDGEVVASQVYAPEGGWLVAYADDAGEPGAILGHTAVEAGEQRDVTLLVDPYQVTETLYLRLHADGGEEGAFEFPGADEPLEVDGEVVQATVAIDLLVTAPSISVADQQLGAENTVLLEGVGAAQPGWVAVQADDGGEPGQILGITPVEEGLSENVVVRIDWRNATRPLHAVLYADSGEMALFEPGDGDEVVQVDGQPLQATFVVTGPPDIYVINQPVVEPEIVVERVFVNEPGWVVVYSNFEGLNDRLLGYAAVEAGETRLLAVPIDPGNTTDMLHVQLHADSGVSGEFEYPADDPALLNEDGQPVRTTMETDTGNYVVTQDQALDGDTLVVPLVVSDLDTWVVVWDGAPNGNGEATEAEIVGQALVERGVRRDVAVTVDIGSNVDTLYVVLHQDAGILGEFEYPGEDEILRRERAAIMAPVELGD